MVNSKAALEILYKYTKPADKPKDDWEPQVGDYIKTTSDFKTRFGNIKEGSRGKIQKIHPDNRYGCVIFSIHQAIILNKFDIEKYIPKKYNKN